MNDPQEILDSLAKFEEELCSPVPPSLSEYLARHIGHPDRQFYLMQLIRYQAEHRLDEGIRPLSLTYLTEQCPEFASEICGLPLDELEPKYLQPEELDHYVIRESVNASSGQGFVLIGYVKNAGLKVAIKFPRTNRSQEWLQTERGCLEKLSHPCFPKIHGFGEYRGRPYIAMHWIEGTTLTRACTSRSLETARAVTLVKQLASGVEHLHSVRIVHRDLSPNNVMVHEGSMLPLIFDFGLATHIDAWHDQTGQNSNSDIDVVGTPGFMPPEQARREAADGVKSDVFHLGALLFFCVTGKYVFAGSNERERIANTIEEHFNAEELRAFRRENAKLALVCEKAIAANPEARYATARDFFEALDAYEQSVRPRSSPWLLEDKRRLAATIASCILVAVGLIWVGSQWFGGRPEPNSIPPELAQLCKDRNFDLEGMSKDDFEVKVTLVPSYPDSYEKPLFGLRHELEPRFHFHFNFDPEIGLLPAFRVFPREWRSALVDVAGTDDWDKRSFYGVVEQDDITASGPLQVKLVSGEYPDGYYTVGPFDFDRNIKAAIEEAYNKREQQEIEAARDSLVLRYEPPNQQDFAFDGKWQLSLDVLGDHRLAYSKIYFGSARDNLDRVVDFLNPPSGLSERYSWEHSVYAPEHLGEQFARQIEGLELSPELYARVEWIDGTDSEGQLCRRREHSDSAEPHSVVDELLADLIRQKAVAYLEGSREGVGRIDFRFGIGARLIDRIEYGRTKGDWELSAIVRHREATSKEDLEHAQHGNTTMDIDKGFEWQVIDIFPQNEIPYPNHWKNIFFRLRYLNGEYSEVVRIENNKNYLPGLRLNCSDQNAPNLYLCSSFNGFRLFWYSPNEEIADMSWEDGRRLESLGYGNKNHVKAIELSDLDEGLTLRFDNESGDEKGCYTYEFLEEELREVFAEQALQYYPRSLSVKAYRYANATEHAIRRYSANSGSLKNYLLDHLKQLKTKNGVVLQGVYIDMVSGFTERSYEWASVIKIRVGPSADNLPIVRDVELPMNNLINGNPDGTPLLWFSVPEDYQEIWYSFDFSNGSSSDPLSVRLREVDLSRWDQ